MMLIRQIGSFLNPLKSCKPMMMYLIGAIVLLCLIIVVVLLVPGTDKKRK